MTSDAPKSSPPPPSENPPPSGGNGGSNPSPGTDTVKENTKQAVHEVLENPTDKS
jgi:hypothetical protein